ncbi:coiled-coil domain-containing protein 160 [Heptranchias perlo]|uniref:coiled-coil domain-containing protein 160 n=1 Tax=Heptranchias perlo TaxID=212740 RepID=UPI00355A3697
MAGVEEQHWVQELFPPHFSTQDLLGAEFTSQPVLVSEQFAAGRAKRIENIYQQEMKNFQDERKLKRKAYLSGLIVQEPACEPASAAPVKFPGSWGDDQSVCKLDNLNISDEKGTEEMEEQYIWSAEELLVLHQAMCRKDSQQHTIEAQLAVAHFEAEELKADSKKLAVCLEMKETELHKTKLEIQNRTLHLGHIMQENSKKDLQIRDLKEDLQEEMATVRSLSSELQRTRLEVQDQRLRMEKLTSDWKKLSLRQEFEKVLLAEKLKEESGLELKKLQTELDVVKTELSAEEWQHAHSKKGLELLCKHFSCLPSLGPAEDFKIEFLNK